MKMYMDIAHIGFRLLSRVQSASNAENNLRSRSQPAGAGRASRRALLLTDFSVIRSNCLYLEVQVGRGRIARVYVV